MMPRIRTLQTLENYRLSVLFDDGKRVLYDVAEDMRTLPGYRILADVPGLFRQVRVDESRTCVFWNEDVDLPADSIYEYGAEVSDETPDT